MRRKQLTLLLVIVGVGNSALAAELWRGATAGMSQADIVDLFPDSAKRERGRPFLPGATLSLYLPEVEFSSYQFEAEFYFSDSGLVQVALVNRKIEKRRQFRKACEAFKSALNSEYGRATTERIAKTGWGRHQYAVFKRDRLLVKLSCDMSGFLPLRVVFQSAQFVEEFAPFGLPVGMPFDEIVELMPEQPSMDPDISARATDLATDTVVVSSLVDVPHRPQGNGDLHFEVRMSKRYGLCFIKATLAVPEEKNFEHILKAASLMPSPDLFGSPTKRGGIYAPFKLSLLPKPIVFTISDSWITTADETLPGSVDMLVYLVSSAKINGKKARIAIVQYLFTNMATRGLTREDVFKGD